MRCPKCGLINPEDAMRCDCGYDFATGIMKKSYLEHEAKTTRLFSLFYKQKPEDIYRAIAQKIVLASLRYREGLSAPNNKCSSDAGA